MISTIQYPAPNKISDGRGFTLVELIVGMTLSLLLMVGILGSVLAFQRSATRLVSYRDMDAEARKGLELFGRDTRMAGDIVWNSSTSIELTVPTATGLEKYRYEYNATTKTFTRLRTFPSSAEPAKALISGIESFTLKGYMITGTEVDLTNTVLASKNTKQLQLTVTSARNAAAVARASNNVISARFILRNKRVTA